MDSAQKIANCIQASARDLDLLPPSDEAAKRIIGLGLSEAMAILFPQLDQAQIAALVERYRHHWLLGDTTPQALFAGVEKGLQQLAEQGVFLAIATGKSRVGLNRVFADLDIESLFVTSRCADETRSKPHPQMLEEILEFTSIDPHKALMIGDTTYDMDMAGNAGIAGLGVAYGVHQADELSTSGAITVVDDFERLMAWLLNGRIQAAFSES